MRGCNLTADALDAKNAQELVRLVVASGLASHPVARTAPSRSEVERDLTQYEIHIESSAGTFRATLTDHDMSGSAAPLIAFLMKHAHPMALDS